jgi:hypothetical protein
MVNTDSIRNKIEAKIFTGLGSTALRCSLIEGSVDTFGDRTDSFASSSSITIVPWAYIYEGQEFFDFGDLQKGEVDIALRYSQDINIGDKIIWNSKDYVIKNLEWFIVKDANLVKVARLKEII